MNEAAMNEGSPNTGVALEATLPIAWSAAGEVTHSLAELRMQTNISLLRALAAIDVVAPEHETHGEATQKALERVEAKMDVVLLLVAQLMGVSKPLPPETPGQHVQPEHCLGGERHCTRCRAVSCG